MVNVVITNHASERIKERVGIKSAKQKQRWANSAFELGYREEDCSGKSAKILANYQRKEIDKDFVMYQDQVCVFANGYLLTVLPINNAYAKTMCKDRAKRKGNHAKRYQYVAIAPDAISDYYIS